MSNSVEEIRVVNDDIVYYPKIILGQGSKGHVYRGTFNSQPAAIKRILNSHADTDIELREIELLKEMIHEHVVKYYGYHSTDDFHFIAMELCAASDLYDLISKEYKGPSPGDSSVVLHQITQGLAYLHSRRIVHRDLKPANILISQPDDLMSAPKLKLADFGLSKRQRREDSISLSCTGSFGTLGWAAPELLGEGITQFTLAIDIFSLGCIFGYVLTGSHPFGDKLARGANIIAGNIDSWASREIADTTMEELILKMISLDPILRPTIVTVLEHFSR